MEEYCLMQKQVAEILDISDANSSTRNFNDKQVVILKNSDMQDTHFRKLNNAGEKFLTESGVYKLIFKSRKEEAERFQDWVTDVVLPTIRKTGGYVANTRTFVDTYFSAMDEAGKEFLVLTLDKKLEVENELKKAKEVIEQQKPAVDFTKRLVKSKENILVREYAKILQDEGFNFGEKKLYAWLRENKFLMKNNEPYQKYMKYFVVIERVVQAMHGDILTRTTKITPEGQVYLFHKIKECN